MAAVIIVIRCMTFTVQHRNATTNDKGLCHLHPPVAHDSYE
ncbi:unnamed protein product, partial [Iphiclides podalirius]